MNKVLFNMEKDIVLIFVYLPASESPFYRSKTLKGIPYLKEHVSDIIQNGDNNYMILGDLNSRCGEQSECAMTDGTVPELDDHIGFLHVQSTLTDQVVIRLQIHPD